jgi:cation transport ATPase
MSTVKNAYRSMILILSLATLLYAQLFYCYQANLINTPYKCYTHTEVCRIVTSMSDAFVAAAMPIMFMMIFGMMTISNVRQTQRRLQPLPMSTLVTATNGTLTNQAQQQQRRSKKTDRHLLVMLLFQVIILTLLSLPFIVAEIYSTLTATQYKTPLQTAIVNFVFNFALLLVYLCCGTPFYIYTLSGGSVFRSALWNIVKNAGRMMRCLPA